MKEYRKNPPFGSGDDEDYLPRPKPLKKGNEKQGGLFDKPATPSLPNTPGLSRRSDPHTSHEAASEASAMSGAQAQAIYEVIVAAGQEGLTAHEIDIALAGRWPTAATRTPRIAGLQRSGLVRDSGRTRLSPSGRKMIVWISCGEPGAIASPDWTENFEEETA